MSNPNPHNEHDSMSDARLDELLDLAKPKLDPTRQKTLRRTVGQTLKSSRPCWWKIFDSSAPDSCRSVIGLLAVGACLLLLVGFGWLVTPNSNRTETVAIAGSSKSATSVKPMALSGSELARLYPPIISRSRAVAIHREIFVPRAREQVRILSKSLPLVIETSLLTIARLDSGLVTVDQFANVLDKAAADIAANRVALLNSRVHRFQKEQGLLELEQQNERLHLARQQLESYLADAVERLPEQQAALAFRILCRVGTESSLPLILKYRNIESTQADASLAISKLAGTRLLEKLILETNNVDIQSQLMAGLLCRHDSGSLDLFLELTAKYDLYSVAQKSGGIADCVPTEMLMQRLRSNRANIARAAAITMSGMSDPNITEYLLQMAHQTELHQSAVMALTARTDDSAIRFVQLASNDVNWSATVINEKKKWSRILAVN